MNEFNKYILVTYFNYYFVEKLFSGSRWTVWRQPAHRCMIDNKVRNATSVAPVRCCRRHSYRVDRSLIGARKTQNPGSVILQYNSNTMGNCQTAPFGCQHRTYASMRCKNVKRDCGFMGWELRSKPFEDEQLPGLSPFLLPSQQEPRLYGKTWVLRA